MSTSETTIHDVRGIYWDRSEECLHLHIVSDRGIFSFVLFHDKDRQPEVVQATVSSRHNPASKMAEAAAEQFQKELDAKATP